jgi:hypothetical protein
VSKPAYKIYSIASPDGGRMVFIDRVRIESLDHKYKQAACVFERGFALKRVIPFGSLYSTREKALAALAALLDTIPLSPPPPSPPPAPPIEPSHQCTKTEPAAAQPEI